MRHNVLILAMKKVNMEQIYILHKNILKYKQVKDTYVSLIIYNKKKLSLNFECTCQYI